MSLDARNAFQVIHLVLCVKALLLQAGMLDASQIVSLNNLTGWKL